MLWAERSDVLAIRGGSELARAVSNPLSDAAYMLGLAQLCGGRFDAVIASTLIPALCHFFVHYYETLYIQRKDISIAQSLFFEKRIDGAHRRFMSAAKTLAVVRKLALPNLLVALGENQLFNLNGQPPAGPTPSPLD